MGKTALNAQAVAVYCMNGIAEHNRLEARVPGGAFRVRLRYVATTTACCRARHSRAADWPARHRPARRLGDHALLSRELSARLEGVARLRRGGGTAAA